MAEAENGEDDVDKGGADETSNKDAGEMKAKVAEITCCFGCITIRKCTCQCGCGTVVAFIVLLVLAGLGIFTLISYLVKDTFPVWNGLFGKSAKSTGTCTIASI